jgi:hypothetical protein
MARGKYARAAARRREDADVQAEIDGLNRTVANLRAELEQTQERAADADRRHRLLVERLTVERDTAAGPEVERLKRLNERLLLTRGYSDGQLRGQLQVYRRDLTALRERVVAHFVQDHGMRGGEAHEVVRGLGFVSEDSVPDRDTLRFEATTTLLGSGITVSE